MSRRTSHIGICLVFVLATGCSQADDRSHDNNDGHHDQDAGEHHHEDAGHHDAEHSHDGGHESDADASIDVGPDVTITPAARDYCECMLVNCHEPFHDRWGEADPVAIANCEVEASQLPATGAEEMSGNHLQCRQYHCTQAANGAETCPSALGDGECQ